MRTLVGICFGLYLTSCTYIVPLSPHLRHDAETNRLHALNLKVGQTLEEVRSVMGKEPERRDVRRRFDGKTVEVWSYATDYVRRLDTTITFIDGRVEEVKTLPWYEED